MGLGGREKVCRQRRGDWAPPIPDTFSFSGKPGTPGAARAWGECISPPVASEGVQGPTSVKSQALSSADPLGWVLSPMGWGRLSCTKAPSAALPHTHLVGSGGVGLWASSDPMLGFAGQRPPRTPCEYLPLSWPQAKHTHHTHSQPGCQVPNQGWRGAGGASMGDRDMAPLESQFLQRGETGLSWGPGHGL